MAAITGVPFINARPSFEVSSTVFISAFNMASLPDILSPLYIASPSPSMTRTILARGARSPLAPKEPFSGIMGWTPLFSISSNVFTVSSLIPENPFANALARSSITPLTVSSGRGFPIEQAWLTIKFL
ncbi:hypothetical protein SDC9_152296 [bioreactor metagenome]|uniref:Uncharacterized protein n=1 Tax=bioreactor metagenome TaxID=1076179 RepID=A0A645EUD9_9ZZZZ